MFASVQYARGFAALAIVIDHAAPDGPWVAVLVGGVELFFVISGFVMVVSTRDKPFSRTDFLWRRFIRIYPMWWILSLSFIAVTGGWGAYSWGDMLLNYALLPIFGANGYVAYPLILGVGWTLVFEVAFYLLFALAAGRLAVLIPVLLALSLLNTLFLAFVLGMALAYYLRDGHPLHWALLPAGLALLFLVGWGQTEIVPGAIGAARVVAALMILCGLIAVFEGTSIAPLRALGDCSYSLYLSHLTVLALLGVVRAPGYVWLATVPICILIGLASYWAIERPMMRYFRSRRRRVETPDPG